MSRRKTPKSHLPPLPFRVFAITFFIAATSLFLVVLFFAFASATITVYPKLVPRAIERTLTITTDPSPIDPQLITATPLTTQIAVSENVSNLPRIPHEGRAEGSVTIVNAQTREQTIVAGSRLQNEAGVIFRTQAPSTIPAGKSQPDVHVVADQAGSTGDLNEGRLFFTALAYLKDRLYAEIEAPFRGGGEEEIVPAELAALRERLIAQAKRSATEELSRTLSPRQKLLAETLAVTIDDETLDSVSQESSQYRLSATVTGYAVDLGELTRTAILLAGTDLPDKDSILTYQPETIAVKILTQNETGATIHVTVTVATGPRLTAEDFPGKALAAKNKAGLATLFQSRSDVERFTVVTSPRWLPLTPFVKNRIRVVVKNPPSL
ncbi:MAG: baseplate J/gp47 family protein [Parcubacteria group bacterium]|nr:baseplate J/gp47 family protein [Parcubacteria group bacterium]